MATLTHTEQHHWRLVWPGGTAMDEPHHDVSIRENPPGACALQVIDRFGRPIHAVELSGGWHPVWYRCRSFENPHHTRCIVFGRALPVDDGIQVEIEAIVNGQHAYYVPPKYIDRLAIATQTVRTKG